MRNILFMAMAFFITLAGSVTAQTVACTNNFDHDTPGEAPILDPPGDPDGDRLALFTVGGPITVQESVGSISGQPVLLDRTQEGSFGLTIVLDPDMWYCDAYSIRWRSASRNNLFFFSIAARSANYKLLSSIEYRQGLVMTFRSSALEIPGGYQIDVMQEFVITLDMVAGTTSLSVDGIAPPELQDIAQFQINGDGLQKLAFSPGGLENLQFVVDDIEITSDCEEVANESVNWGAVKSLYR
jgi:hypothetical protein